MVSTMKRDNKLKAMDEMISLVTDLIAGDIGRADLSKQGDYETMVFPAEGDEITDYAELDFARYETFEEAAEGHKQMVKKWREMPPGIARDPDVHFAEEN